MIMFTDDEPAFSCTAQRDAPEIASMRAKCIAFYNPQSNGILKRMVHIIKTTIMKMNLDKRDCGKDEILNLDQSYWSHKMADGYSSYVLIYERPSCYLGRGEVSNLEHDGNGYAKNVVSMTLWAATLLAEESCRAIV